MNNKRKVLTVSLVAVLIGAAAALLTESYHPNNVTIASLPFREWLDEVEYFDTDTFDWGTCAKGYSYIFNYTVQNIGNIVGTFYITLTNLPEDWSVTWSVNNTVLQPLGIAEGDLTLTIADSAIPEATYNWEMYTTGTDEI